MYYLIQSEHSKSDVSIKSFGKASQSNGKTVALSVISKIKTKLLSEQNRKLNRTEDVCTCIPSSIKLFDLW